MGRDLEFKKSYDTASIALGVSLLPLAQPMTGLLNTVGVLEQNSCVAHVCMYLKIGDMALLLYEQPSN